MAATWKTVRVFISSTFRDMQAERDWLVKRVFPALRQKLEPLRIHLVDIDLRWGITREQAENDQVLDLCLQQIDECRPFFLGLLGGRYGWVPAKFPVEVGIRYGWTQHYTGKSVTELEILHGVLNDSAMQERALFCFRSDPFLAAIQNEQQRRIYVEEPTDEELRELGPEEAERRAEKRRRQLADLKNEIRALSPPMPLFDGYPCTWDPAALEPAKKLPGRIGGLTEFGNWVTETLERTILDTVELQEHFAAARSAERDELGEERDFHERFIETRTRVYVGRQILQDQLLDFVTGMEAKPCLVTGPSGSGKSAALAKLVTVWRDQHPEDIVITHFVGASPRSTGLREMLRHLCAELQEALNLEDEIKQDIRELSDQFREFLTKAPADHLVILVLDAVNQLDELNSAHSLYWLPWQLPPQARLIVSCIDDPDRTEQPALAALRHRQPHEIPVGPLNDEDRLGIVREIPSVAAKTLDEAQVKLLLQNEATRNPLFLLVALEELRGFGSFEQLNEKIAALPQTDDTLTGIFQQVIHRLGVDFDAQTVENVLTLLACSRRGLSERELQDQIEGESVAIEISTSDLFPILRQLRPYLQSRGPLLDFFHRHLAKATHVELFEPDADVQISMHHRLAGYFAKQADPERTSSWQGEENARAFSELPFHLAHSDVEEVVKVLCDLRFVEARCRLGQVFELINDYKLARENLPEAQEKVRVEYASEERVRRWTAEIIEYAQRSSDGTTPEPVVPESPPACEIWSEEQIYSERKRIIQAPTRRDRLEAFTSFIGGHCYSLLKYWHCPGFVLQLAFNANDGGVVHDAAVPLVATLGAPHLLRRWSRYAVLNPRPGLLFALDRHDMEVSSVSITPDGRRAVSGSYDETLRVWNLDTGQCLRTLEGHSGKIFCVSITPDGRRAISGSWGTLRVWDLDTGQCLRTLEGHSGGVYCVSITPDGRRAVSGGDDATLRVWDLDTGQCLRTLEGHSGGVYCVSITPDGRRAVSGGDDATLRVWDLDIGQCLRTLEGHSRGVNCVSITPDGRRAVSGGDDVTLRVWNLDTGQCLCTLEGHSGYVRCVCITPDGRRAVSSGDDATLRVWDLDTGQCLRTLEGHSRGVNCVSITPDGRRAVSGDNYWKIEVWDLCTAWNPKPLEGHSGEVSCVSITPDGRRAVSGSVDGKQLVWDLDSGECLHSLRWVDSWVRCVSITPDGRRAVSGREGSTMPVWYLDGGRPHRMLRGHSSSVCCVSITPDGRRAVSGSEDNTLRVWDLDTGQCLRTLEGHSGGVYCVSITPDGRRAVSGGDDATLRVWDLDTGQCLHTLRGHSVDPVVSCVAVTPDGRRAVSGSDDCTLRVWDLDTGACLCTFEGHIASVVQVCVTPDGRCAVSISSDGTVQVWELESGKTLAMYLASSPITALALNGSGDAICVGTVIGEMIILEAHHLPLAPRP